MLPLPLAQRLSPSFERPQKEQYGGCGNCVSGRRSDLNSVFFDRGGLREGSCSVAGMHRHTNGRTEGYASLLDVPLRIPRHFPQMSIRVLEVPRVAAPESIMGWFHNDGTRARCLAH